jgi:hypothetical protein
MPAVLWNEPGAKLYEDGIDKGVVYADGTYAAWNGLVSVTRDPFIRSREQLFLDGQVYGHQTVYGGHSGSITAYTYPDILLPFLGYEDKNLGVFFDDQPSEFNFNLSYRTKIGNDLEGLDKGYKIHLLYNVSLVPDAVESNTIDSSAEPDLFGWSYSCIPDKSVANTRPVSHIVIDSTKAPLNALNYIEEVLYDVASSGPRMPSALEVLTLMDAGADVLLPLPATNRYPSTTVYPDTI